MMLVTDHLLASRSSRWSVQNPTPRNVARVLGRLDARRHTVVALRADEDQHLVICGGEGQFLICATDGPEKLFELIRIFAQGCTATLNIGGRVEELPVERVLDRETALTCALTYLYTGKRDLRFRWRES